MFCDDKVMNALMASIQLEYLTKKHPLFCQEAYHYMLDWLALNLPEKLPVFLSQETHDYYDGWSLERQNLWQACFSVAFHLEMSHIQGVQLPVDKVDRGIREALGMPLDQNALADDKNSTQEVEDFDFETYLKDKIIDPFGLGAFISAVEKILIALEGFDPRFIKVSEALIFQDFIAQDILCIDEQIALAQQIEKVSEYLFIYPKRLIDSLPIDDQVRSALNLNEKHVLRVV